MNSKDLSPRISPKIKVPLALILVILVLLLQPISATAKVPGADPVIHESASLIFNDFQRNNMDLALSSFRSLEVILYASGNMFSSSAIATFAYAGVETDTSAEEVAESRTLPKLSYVGIILLILLIGGIVVVTVRKHLATHISALH